MRLYLLVLVAIAANAYAESGEIMHCFAFTRVASASDKDWTDFEKATHDLRQKIPGLKRVTLGKLLKPMPQMRIASNPTPDEIKQYRAGKEIDARIVSISHNYAVCMEFLNEVAFDAYGKNEIHAAWQAAYFKVREPAPSTFQIVVPQADR